ncbi:unnamed protein product [Paramecium octaurelia]|uniref:Uncharacterized protein n=1 Tax=Paramecium octaurelia TaxID=43137 RepID=A0A8S1WQZ4_PAROT|nr:unnamed protein product [Paramecium octaurelia]
MYWFNKLQKELSLLIQTFGGLGLYQEREMLMEIKMMGKWQIWMVQHL